VDSEHEVVGDAEVIHASIFVPGYDMNDEPE